MNLAICVGQTLNSQKLDILHLHVSYGAFIANDFEKIDLVIPRLHSELSFV